MKTIKLLSLIILFPFFFMGQAPGSGQIAPAPQATKKQPMRDWLKVHDDVTHFYAGFFICMTASEITYYYTDRPGLSCLVGIGAGFTADVCKEFIHDKMLKKGVFSYDDLFMTAWGTVIGAMVERCWIDWRERKRNVEKFTQDYKKHLLD